MRKTRNFSQYRWLYDTVDRVYGVNRIEGGPEIGVEIEVEGQNLIVENPQYYWKVTQDGSLRVLEPEDRAMEYVFRKPLDRAATTKALEYLHKKLTDHGAKVFKSGRTSVHIHLNASDLKLIDVYRWLVLYYIFEPTLMKYCGESRMGNHFCLSGLDAENVVTSVADSLQAGAAPSSNNDLRYAACNYTALGKFGTLEFRAHEGTIDSARIQMWIDILLAIKDSALSERFNTPKDIVDEFSRRGPMDFAESVFGRELMGHLPITGSDLFEGARLAQEIAYGFPWEDYLEFRKKNLVKPEPVQQYILQGPVAWVPPPIRNNLDNIIIRMREEAIRNNIRDNQVILDEEDQ